MSALASFLRSPSTTPFRRRRLAFLSIVLVAGVLAAEVTRGVRTRRSAGVEDHQPQQQRWLQDDNPFANIGPLLIQLLRLICLIFGGTPASCGLTPPANVAFNIRLQYDSTVPLTHRVLFEEAKTLFERIITADVPDVPLEILTDTVPKAPGCSYPDVVDDIYICVYYTANVPLGKGGYNNRRIDSGLPITGSIAINNALPVDEFLRDLIVHEMAHALGVGTVPICPTTISASAAQREYQAISGCSTPLPVDSDCGHLAEACLTDEMMTPTLWQDGLNVFSRITIGWLQDLGYTVNYGPADVFEPSRLGTVPGCRCNQRRRLGDNGETGAGVVRTETMTAGASVDVVVPFRSLEEADADAKATARQFYLASRPDKTVDDTNSQRERALAITVLEQGRPYTVVERE